MSTFSRGCIKLHSAAVNSSRISLSTIPKSCSIPRFFTSTSIFRSTARKPMPMPTQKVGSKPVSRVKPNITTNPQTFASPVAKTSSGAPKVLKYYSYADILAQKPHTTTLYQAPSHTGFITSSYLSGTFLLGFAGLTFWNNYIHLPIDISPWVPYAFAGISFLLACCGGYSLLAPAGLIKSITAVPAQLCAHPPKIAAPLYVEVTLRKLAPIPFMPARTYVLTPSSLHLKSHLYLSRTPAEERKWKRLLDERKEELAEYDRTHIIGRGTRKFSGGAFELVRSYGRCWTREGIIDVRITERGSGRILKLDAAAGWAQDGGRALEKLISVQET